MGSIHAVIDTAETIVSTQDFDMWGHELDGRTSSSQNARYDFTGKERDTETGYDYFGARYYDSRIGRWGGVDKILNYRNYELSPYHYSRNNSLVLVDPNGKDAIPVWFYKYNIGVSGISVPGIGDFGILLIDNKTGNVSYFDYGRYGENDMGKVRGYALDKVRIDEDGNLNQSDISERLKDISNNKLIGKGALILGAYIKSDKYEEMYNFANQKLVETSESDLLYEYTEYWNNCVQFAVDVIDQDDETEDLYYQLPPNLPANVWSQYAIQNKTVYYDQATQTYQITR